MASVLSEYFHCACLHWPHRDRCAARLGFEGDANVVMQYYSDVAGGTQGGWTPEKEQEVRAAIEAGLRLAKKSRGQTIGQQMLAADSMMDDEYVRMLERKASGVPMHQHNELVNHVAANKAKALSWEVLQNLGLWGFVAEVWGHVANTTKAEDAVAATFISALAVIMLALSKRKKI